MKRSKKILEGCWGAKMSKFEADNLHINLKHAKKPSLLLVFQQLNYGRQGQV
jgi:hypothetical protein